MNNYIKIWIWAIGKGISGLIGLDVMEIINDNKPGNVL